MPAAEITRAAAVDQHHAAQGQQRYQRQQRRRRVGPGEIEVLEALLDEQGQRLRLSRHLARDDAHGAELADRTGGGEHDAVHETPADGGQGDPPERLPARCPECRGGLLLVLSHLAQDRRHLPDHERQRHEDRR
jgi:hypothetical protein